jgi:hypothetical protein
MDSQGKVVECRSCHAAFVVEPSEAAWLAERGLQAPSHCRSCRQLRKRIESEGDETRECVVCHSSFVWTAKERALCAVNRWPPPRYCEPCRAAYKRDRAQQRSLAQSIMDRHGE